MAVVTPEEFTEIHPQFSQASPSMVAAALQAAMAACDEGVFGKQWNYAVRLKACHILSLEKFGQQEPVEEGAENPYEAEFDRIVRTLPKARMTVIF